jgi:caspase domain-containing protein
VRWAIVIGIDEYGSDELRLYAAVSDALKFRDWVVAADGGGVPASNLRLLLARRSDDPSAGDDALDATKDNIVTAINDVVVATAEHEVERLYFYFAGHGITARVANRDESALVTPGFDALHTDHSLAVRSIAEYFETTSFADQFLFIDACRNVPWADQEFEIGRWPVPRRREPGARPVQQFVLYATSPGRPAAELGWPGEARGAFTGTLLEGLAGTEDAKAWSWERNCYEVRWERLATFVNRKMRQRADRPPEVPARDWPIQIPQDTGARGVADRDRDVPVVSFTSGRFPNLELTIHLTADAKYDEAVVSVLDAVGEPVVRALGVTGTSQTFQLAPKTYAVRATTTAPEALVGSLKAPIDLYWDRTEEIGLRPRAAPPGGPVVAERLGPEDIAMAGREQPPGTIAISSPDPLAVAEIRDEAGRVVAVTPAGEALEAKPGFYHVRHIGPEATQGATFVVLAAGEREEVLLQPPPPEPFVAALATALGGRVQDGYVSLVDEDDLMTWALPSTIVAAGVAASLQERELTGLGVDVRRALGKARSGVAVFAVGRREDDEAVRRLSVGIWPAGEPVGPDSVALKPSAAGVAGVVAPVGEPMPYWVSLTSAGAAPTVVAVPVLPDRLATLVAQVDSDRTRLYQYHPGIGPGTRSTVSELRRAEYLQRMLVAGRVDVAEPLAKQVASAASDDPFAGLVAGYVLLRLGRHKELEALASSILVAASGLSDAYVLRGEFEASIGRPQAATQAFADAINTGIPAFGEGLTRLVEGLRASGFIHPRGALVRHVFQRHVRGSMWSAFTPRRGLEPGRPAISAMELGFEA